MNQKQCEKKLEDWVSLNTNITKLSNDNYKKLIEHELAHKNRWTFLNRIFGAQIAKRTKLERAKLFARYTALSEGE